MAKYPSDNKTSIRVLWPHAPDARDRQIREAQRHIDDQRACLQRMIVQGCPMQFADDLLSNLLKALRQLGGH